ncbi:TPA: YadA-like family protein [Haemophilus influenzae]
MVGKASFSAAVGGYGSCNAMAIGVGYTPKANITLKSGINYSFLKHLIFS